MSVRKFEWCRLHEGVHAVTKLCLSLNIVVLYEYTHCTLVISWNTTGMTNQVCNYQFFVLEWSSDLHVSHANDWQFSDCNVKKRPLTAAFIRNEWCVSTRVLLNDIIIDW